MDFRKMLVNGNPGNQSPERRDNSREGDQSPRRKSPMQGTWSAEKHAATFVVDTSLRGELINLARSAWDPRKEGQATSISDTLVAPSDNTLVTTEYTKSQQQSSLSDRSSDEDSSFDEKNDFWDPGPQRITEHAESPQRMPYTKEQLQNHITTLLDELKTTQTEKIVETSIGKLWRKEGKELTKEEVDNIKQIVVDLREKNLLDSILSGKNGNIVCNKIRAFAVYCNPKDQEIKKVSNATYRKNTENKTRHNEYNKVYRRKTKK